MDLDGHFLGGGGVESGKNGKMGSRAALVVENCAEKGGRAKVSDVLRHNLL